MFNAQAVAIKSKYPARLKEVVADKCMLVAGVCEAEEELMHN